MKLDFTIVVVNNAASGYVRTLQHLMYGPGAYQASDLAETDYTRVATALGCRRYCVEDPGGSGAVLSDAMAGTGPALIDLIVTRDPIKMLPAVDNRAVQVKKGNRAA